MSPSATPKESYLHITQMSGYQQPVLLYGSQDVYFS